MARGRLLKTKVKEAYSVGKASAEGQIAGEYKAHSKKSLVESTREHIGRLIDNISIDPVEAVAVVGMTLLVKDTLMNLPDLLAKVAATESEALAWIWNQVTGFISVNVGIDLNKVIGLPSGSNVTFYNGYVIVNMIRYTAPVLPGQTGTPVYDVIAPKFDAKGNMTFDQNAILFEAKDLLSAEQWVDSHPASVGSQDMMQTVKTWLVSFAIAYLLVHNSMQLTNLMGQGLVAVVSLLLA